MFGWNDCLHQVHVACGATFSGAPLAPLAQTRDYSDLLFDMQKQRKKCVTVVDSFPH